METAVNGNKAYYYNGDREFDRNQESVIFIHGAGMDHTVWTLPARYFARHNCNVFALDLPGHGRSDGPLLTSIEAAADWIGAFIDSIHVNRTALVGHSMGSLIALEAAARFPNHVRALALLGSAFPMQVSDALLNAAKADDHAAIDMLTFWGYSQRGKIGNNETPGLWMVDGTMRLFERSQPGVIFNDLNACNEYKAGEQSAAKVRCPALFILGQRDIMTPVRNSRNISESIAGSRTLVLKGSGHTMLSEQPDAVLDALIEIV